MYIVWVYRSRATCTVLHTTGADKTLVYLFWLLGLQHCFMRTMMSSLIGATSSSSPQVRTSMSGRHYKAVLVRKTICINTPKYIYGHLWFKYCLELQTWCLTNSAHVQPSMGIHVTSSLLFYLRSCVTRTYIFIHQNKMWH